MAKLEKIKSNPVAQLVWIVVMTAVHIIIYKSKIEETAIWVRIIYVILAIVITLPLHELCHYVVFMIFGKGKAKIGFGIDPVGLPSLKTTVYAELTRRQKVIASIAPLFFITIVPDIIFIFSENIYLFFFFMSICNAAGCSFDVIDSIITIVKKK